MDAVGVAEAGEEGFGAAADDVDGHADEDLGGDVAEFIQEGEEGGESWLDLKKPPGPMGRGGSRHFKS